MNKIAFDVPAVAASCCDTWHIATWALPMTLYQHHMDFVAHKLCPQCLNVTLSLSPASFMHSIDRSAQPQPSWSAISRLTSWRCAYRLRSMTAPTMSSRTGQCLTQMKSRCSHATFHVYTATSLSWLYMTSQQCPCQDQLHCTQP